MSAHEIHSDGTTVWVNGVGGLLGRFGKNGIDIHRPLDEQQEKGQCLFCTHEPVTAEDWKLFRAKMLEHFNIKVSDLYKPRRFR
jgi:hypothetical protein